MKARESSLSADAATASPDSVGSSAGQALDLVAALEQAALELGEAANVFHGKGLHGLGRVYFAASKAARAVIAKATGHE